MKKIASDLWRIRMPLSGPQGSKVRFDNQSLLSFSSNDYLGLSNHPAIVGAFCQGAIQYGVGSGASQYLSGYRNCHQRLEQEFSTFLKRDQSLLFSCGYMANLGLSSLFREKNTVVFQDKQNHASLIDAVKLSGALTKRYAHLNLDHLESLLHQYPSNKKFIVTESVFSMRGDIADIKKISALAKKYQATLIVDEAHAIGWMGETGGGITEFLSLDQEDVPILVCPLGKAFGCAGAIIAGRKDEIAFLTQTARTAIYTTALPPAMSTAALESLHIVKKAVTERNRLYRSIIFFKEQTKLLNLPFLESVTPIQILPMASSLHAISFQEHLLSKGFLVSAIRPPTVHKNHSCLRIILTSRHKEDHILQLLEVIKNDLHS